MVAFTWHLITGEYPPQPGGVSDYTRLIAEGLARAGEDVHVWAPPCAGEATADSAVVVHRLPGRFDLRSLRVLGAALNAWPRPSRLLVQYVPHAYGWKAMNVAFCRWLMRRRQSVWVMFHEVAFPWESGQSWRHQLLGCITHAMAGWIMRSADRMFVAIPGWVDRLRLIGPIDGRIDWLPVPSNLPAEAPPSGGHECRARLGIPVDAPLLGHFGTYGTSIGERLSPVLREFLTRGADRHCLLMGRNGEQFAAPLGELRDRVHVTGELPGAALSACLAGCDALAQPYPDGISCRRGSAMAALALGKPVVSTLGKLSEKFWSTSGAVSLAPADDPDALTPLIEELFANPSLRGQMGDRARQLYQRNFSLDRTIDVLLGRREPLPFTTESL